MYRLKQYLEEVTARCERLAKEVERAFRGELTDTSRLGFRPGDAVLAPCVAVPVSPPISARSSWSSRSHRIGPTRNIAASWNMAPADRSRWSATMPRPARAAWIDNVNNNDADNLPRMKERAQEKGFPFAYLYDPSQKIGRELGASVTPGMNAAS